MPSIPTTSATNSAAAAASPTYTTIPISTRAVIARSIQNLSASLSRRRPWPEFLSSLNLPTTGLSAASLRLRTNCNYFSVNYFIIVAAISAFSLIGSPISLVAVGAIFTLWLLLYFFREDPVFVLGRQVSDRAVTLGLIICSVTVFWVTGALNSLLIGFCLGLFTCAMHGLLRNSDGLFLDEYDAVSNGLLVGPSPNGGVS